ncbi:peptidoglycan-binding domain-containing protein [Streptomyces sp. 4N509B]|uniref:peptidoglycan-binding domain-containing protein n=1 Tax=Streptomyces sp. 4N509B TaxID=3457413 RepID=UPI003FD49175
MLTSDLLRDSADLAEVAAGNRRVHAPENSESVGLVQQALVATGFPLPEFGVDRAFGTETGTAVSAFKTDRGLQPSDPVVGTGTITRLDAELAYLEGLDPPAARTDVKRLTGEPFTAGVVEVLHPDLDITSRVLDFFELGDRICFSMSMAVLDAPQLASFVGRFVEPHITKDFCTRSGPCGADDFFDIINSPAPYTAFLRAHNPGISPSVVDAVGAGVRPDILSHRPERQAEWYEIKPLSPGGVSEGIGKGVRLRSGYEGNGFPYRPGKLYTPSGLITLGEFVTPEGERIEVSIEPRRLLPGLIFYRFCVSGDFVSYFNRVRLAAGILAILAALAPELLAAAATAEEVAAFVQLVRSIAAGLGLALPALSRAL